jgi:hypothetical protein
MAVKPDQIRQAKKFLENKKISIKKVKPHLFAQLLQMIYVILLITLDIKLKKDVWNV